MYLDSAYIAKYYLNETDSETVRRAIHRADWLVSSEWSVAEVASAFHRHFCHAQLTARQLQELSRTFRKHSHGVAAIPCISPLWGRSSLGFWTGLR